MELLGIPRSLRGVLVVASSPFVTLSERDLPSNTKAFVRDLEFLSNSRRLVYYGGNVGEEKITTMSKNVNSPFKSFTKLNLQYNIKLKIC